jgi:pantoate--beta-alanine ligase
MLVVETESELRRVILEQKRQGNRVGFVPTMGNLHEGHLQLVKLALQRADFVVASIFVNPLQFGENEDFDKYPRTHQADIEKLTGAGCSLLFLPSVQTIYPKPMEQQTRVEVPDLSDILCGESRPGHFVGVATVVCKLFNLVSPDVAVFGEKDYQQLMVIRHMTLDLCLPIEIIGAPIVREDDGLAMSSRNGYLDTMQRQLAPKLYEVLSETADKLGKGDKGFEQLEQEAVNNINKLGFRTDYFVIRRADDLQLPEANETDIVILVAAWLGNTRLIDNIQVRQVSL